MNKITYYIKILICWK